MNCKQVRSQLTEFVSDDLSADTQFGMRSHLAGCPACREEVRESSEAVALLNTEAAEIQQAQPSEEFSARLTHAARRQFAALHQRRLGAYRAPCRWLAPAGALSFAVVACLLALLLRPRDALAGALHTVKHSDTIYMVGTTNAPLEEDRAPVAEGAPRPMVHYELWWQRDGLVWGRVGERQFLRTSQITWQWVKFQGQWTPWRLDAVRAPFDELVSPEVYLERLQADSEPGVTIERSVRNRLARLVIKRDGGSDELDIDQQTGRLRRVRSVFATFERTFTDFVYDGARPAEVEKALTEMERQRDSEGKEEVKNQDAK